jgi:hypothetical protein
MPSKKNRKKPEKDHLAPTDWFIGNALCNEEDRGCVLVACAQVERELRHLMSAYFVKHGNAAKEKIRAVLDSDNKNPQALLSSGWSKSMMALLVGAISQETFALYDCLRQLRNDCAHHEGRATLTDKAVAPLVDLLDPVHRTDVDNAIEKKRRGETTFGHPADKFSEARLAFMTACIHLQFQIFVARMTINPPEYKTGMMIAKWEEGGKHCLNMITLSPAPKTGEESALPQQ